jgi:hypothetical protein
VPLNTDGLAAVVQYDDDRVQPLLFDTRVLAVRAHCGSGKSYQANELIKRVRLGGGSVAAWVGALTDDTRRVCVVSPRISFSNAIRGAFEQHNFALYSEVEKLGDHPRVIVQYESLHRLVGADVKYDLVILDELETILGCALSTATNKKHLLTNSRVFEALIGNATKVLALDADLSDKGLGVLKELAGPANITLHVNTRQPLPRTVRLYADELVWLKRLEQKIRAGKKLVIPVTSKQRNPETSHSAVRSMVSAVRSSEVNHLPTVHPVHPVGASSSRAQGSESRASIC